MAAQVDLSAIIQQAIDSATVEVERGMEDKVAEVLRARGWTCTPPPEQLLELRDEKPPERNREYGYISRRGCCTGCTLCYGSGIGCHYRPCRCEGIRT